MLILLIMDNKGFPLFLVTVACFLNPPENVDRHYPSIGKQKALVCQHVHHQTADHKSEPGGLGTGNIA